MKKSLTVLLFFVFASSGFCQDVRLLIKRFRHSHQISESYSVLKSDKTIKHGEYVSYFPYSTDDEALIEKGIKKIEDFIREKGNYNNGKKEGDWVESANKMEIDSGKYSKGEKIGIWNTYIGKDKVRSFDYDNNKKIGIWLTYKENGMVVERFDHDNNVPLEPFIKINISYPNTAIGKKIEGVVRIRFRIKIDCSIDEITILQSLSPECDQAAIDAINEFGELLRKYGTNCVERIEEQEILFRFL